MKANQKAPVISLPKEAEHFVIHSDVGTPAGGDKGAGDVAARRVSVSVRRRRSVERKASPGESRRRSPGKVGSSSRFSAVEPSNKVTAGGINMKQSREGSPSKAASRPEPEEVKTKEVFLQTESFSDVVKQDEEVEGGNASPSSLRREIDVLRLQVKTLREVQEQTAELHWKVISNVVEERNFWAARCKEATVKVSTADAAVSMTPTRNSPAKSETRFVAVPPFTPSFSRSMDVPKIDLFRPQQQIVTRYTLPSSLCILRTPEGVNTLGRRSPVPQVSLLRAARASAPPMVAAATREGVATTAYAGCRSVTTKPPHPVTATAVGATAAPMLEEKAEKKLTVDLSKLPTPCRSMAQAARQCVVSSTATDESKGPKMTSVGTKEQDTNVSAPSASAARTFRCSRCGAVEHEAV
eukprot:symbB.v1.2.010074.t1/scaffold649.1/size176475/4